MIDTSKRISIRVTEQFFYELDDKRQAMRVSFQSLGFALFRSWLECFPGAGFGAAVADSIRAQEPSARIPEEDSAARPPVVPRGQVLEVPPHLRPVATDFLDFWEHPKNPFEQKLKALLAETVLKSAAGGTARKTSGG
jgi:hypothetical protein